MAKKEEWNDTTPENVDVCVMALTQMVAIKEGIKTTGKEKQGKALQGTNSTDLMNGNVQIILIEKDKEEVKQSTKGSGEEHTI